MPVTPGSAALAAANPPLAWSAPETVDSGAIATGTVDSASCPTAGLCVAGGLPGRELLRRTRERTAHLGVYVD